LKILAEISHISLAIKIQSIAEVADLVFTPEFMACD